MSKGIGGHQRAYQGRSDEWLTPPFILDALGPFDLDPCAPVIRPWDMAAKHYTVEDDGLAQPWAGRVWLNSPYGPQTTRWLENMVRGKHFGTALIFARTDTDMFHRWVWASADAVLFIRGRLKFYDVRGKIAKDNAGGPSCIVAYGADDALRLSEQTEIGGAFLRLKRRRKIIVPRTISGEETN